MIRSAFFVSCLASAVSAIQIANETTASAFGMLDAAAQSWTNNQWNSCMVVQKRAKQGALLLAEMAKHKGKSTPWNDPSFAHDMTSIKWPDVDKPGNDDLPDTDELAKIQW